MLPVIEVPQHGLGVLATAGAEGAVRGEGDGVDVAGVTDVVGLQLAVGQVPHLDVLVPPGRHDDRVAVVRGKPAEQRLSKIMERVVEANLTQLTQSEWPSSWMVYLH